MQASDTATGVRVPVCIIFSVRSGMLETNKQTLLFNFGEDLSYFVILRYKLRDLIKIYDAFVNDSVKGDFQKTLLPCQIGKKSLVEYEWFWLHTTRKRLLRVSFMIDNQMV